MPADNRPSNRNRGSSMSPPLRDFSGPATLSASTRFPDRLRPCPRRHADPQRLPRVVLNSGTVHGGVGPPDVLEGSVSAGFWIIIYPVFIDTAAFVEKRYHGTDSGTSTDGGARKCSHERAGPRLIGFRIPDATPVDPAEVYSF